jgi:hypothetical protein
LNANNEILLVVNCNPVNVNPGIFGICGKWSLGSAEGYSAFFGETLQVVSKP